MVFTHINLYLLKNVLLGDISFSDEVSCMGHYDKTW